MVRFSMSLRSRATRTTGLWVAFEAAGDRFVRLAEVQPGQRVLDVGCGPGALTAEVAKRVDPASVLLGQVSSGHLTCATPGAV
jgi:2-polyprenyl-3-methyl-5-hydroxy-6-metoxy-1,4-benzoquinol methylase